MSVNGGAAGRVACVEHGALSAAYRLLEAVTAKGATIVADTLQDRSHGYNLGEQELAHWLTRLARHRYHEVHVGDGVWTPLDEATSPASLMRTRTTSSLTWASPPPAKRPRPAPAPPPPAPAPDPVDPDAWTCFCTSVNTDAATECWVCGMRRP